MEKKQLIQIAGAVIIGIIIGIAIGWLLWHGADTGTCPVPGLK
jgi:F0F1-type ATP synthase assembly protein I